MPVHIGLAWAGSATVEPTCYGGIHGEDACTHVLLMKATYKDGLTAFMPVQADKQHIQTRLLAHTAGKQGPSMDTHTVQTYPLMVSGRFRQSQISAS